MSPEKELAKNTFLIALSKISTQLLVFLMLPVYTALLSVEQYGFVDLVVSYGVIVAPLIMLNLQTALFRYLIDARGHEVGARRALLTNAAEVIGATTLIIATLFLVVNFFVDIPFAGIIIFYVFSVMFSDLVIQIARGTNHTKAFATTTIFQGVLGVALNILLLAFLGMGADGMLLGLGLGFLLPSVVLSFYLGLHRNISLSARDSATKKELLSYSLPMIPNSLAWWVYSVSDRTVLMIVLGAAANGIYAVSAKFAGILGLLSAIFYQSWSESAAVNIGAEPKKRTEFFSEVLNQNVRVFGGLSIIILAGVGLFFPLLVNANFQESRVYIPVLIFGGLLSTIVSYYSAIYLALKKTKQVMNTSIAGAVINLVVNIGLVWFVGIWAAALSTAASYGAMALYRYYDMKKYVEVRYEWRSVVGVLGAFSIVGVLYCVDLPWLNVVNLVLAAGFAFIMNQKLVLSQAIKLQRSVDR